MDTHIFALFIIVAVVSFLGFWVENIWLSLTKGYMDNRNMHLPFLVGYGLAVLAIFFLFGTPVEPRFLSFAFDFEKQWLSVFTYFWIVFFCVSVGEWILGTVVEKTCGIVWWNYSRLPLHITKYTSIPTSIGFSLMISVFMGCIFEPLYRWLADVNYTLLAVVSCTLMSAMMLDFLYSAIWMFRKKKLLSLWKWDMSSSPLYRALQGKVAER